MCGERPDRGAKNRDWVVRNSVVLWGRDVGALGGEVCLSLCVSQREWKGCVCGELSWAPLRFLC